MDLESIFAMNAEYASIGISWLLVNKGMSQIKDDPAIASNLDAVSVSKHNEDYDAGSSGSQKKNSADLDLNQG